MFGEHAQACAAHESMTGHALVRPRIEAVFQCFDHENKRPPLFYEFPALTATLDIANVAREAKLIIALEQFGLAAQCLSIFKRYESR